MVKAYAPIGKLRGGQPKKVATDILKLAMIKNEPGREDTKAVVAFASQEARDSIAGWLSYAAQTFEIELIVVDLPDDIRQIVLDAQVRQKMVNAAAE